MLVVDASVALAASFAPDGFSLFGRQRLVAPKLMWSEARSALHEAGWRAELTAEDVDATRARLESCPVEPTEHDALADETWRIADELGWAKTYDAEYVALARLLDCRMVTLDRRLRRGADRLGLVVSPDEL